MLTTNSDVIVTTKLSLFEKIVVKQIYVQGYIIRERNVHVNDTILIPKWFVHVAH